jgi:hypothetical protein
VGLYKALRSIPRLQAISLDLHVLKTFSPQDHEEDDHGNWFHPLIDDEFDRQVPVAMGNNCEACNGAMREHLIYLMRYLLGLYLTLSPPGSLRHLSPWGI